jgi:hypothetical protein
MARLEEARARKPSIASIADDETMGGLPTRRPSQFVRDAALPPNSKAIRRKEAATIDDLVADFGFLSVHATARDFYGFTSTMSYSRLIMSACTKEALPEGMVRQLPSRQAATALIQHYLTNVLILLPVFDEASLYASVDNIYSNNGQQADVHDHFMVRIVMAIASASRSQQRGDPQHIDAIGHICAAMNCTEEVIRPGSVSSIQALVLLTEYAMLDPHHFDSWSLIGAASRAMVDLGIHQDPPKGLPMPKGKLDLRRRIFWCIYALDRSTSLVQTRAFSFSDDSAKVKAPSTKSASSAPSTPQAQDSPGVWLQQTREPATDLVSLRKLQSAWYTDLFQAGRASWDEPYPYLWDTCDAMRRWFDGLSTSMTENVRAFFELEYLYSSIYVLSPSPRVPVPSHYAQKLIFEYCIRYAELMLRAVSSSTYTAPLTFYDAMRVYMTGRQFVDVLQNNLDGVLDGATPSLPDVKPTTAPPPPLPSNNAGPGESTSRNNLSRAITCIKQITECLLRFGMRWGYMRSVHTFHNFIMLLVCKTDSLYLFSWNQRFQEETSAIVEVLNSRLRDGPVGDAASETGFSPLEWHHNSVGSIGSASVNGNSNSYSDSTQASLSPASVYTLSSSGAHSNSSAAINTTTGLSPSHLSLPSLPLIPRQSQFVSSQVYPIAHANTPSPPPPQQQQQGQLLQHGHPAQQFANWAGYNAPSSALSTSGLWRRSCTEENTMPPSSSSINSVGR